MPINPSEYRYDYDPHKGNEVKADRLAPDDFTETNPSMEALSAPGHPLPSLEHPGEEDTATQMTRPLSLSDLPTREMKALPPKIILRY